ncbi:Guanine nucleotide exchange factor for Cdc42p [Coemansia sp. RSA 1972]|nr:Guanine nucleotide exchange factor for Cdc42p [Coemansia sp. RSA 1972]
MLRPLEVLLAFQRRFLKSLCGRTSVAATAQLFLAEAHKFAVYIDYCGTYHWLCDLLERLKADSTWPNVEDEFQQKMAQYSDKRRLGLRDFLIKPVQRICKYPLFLKELLKYTDVRLESSTFDELNQALASLKGVCEGVDQVQQRIDSLRLRNTLLSSYCDSSKLPLHVVAKLGEVVLSGPLYIAGCSDKGLEPPLTDDGLVHSWQLQHVKSGQFMVFQASSPHEKQMWTDALNGAIVDSKAHIE